MKNNTCTVNKFLYIRDVKTCRDTPLETYHNLLRVAPTKARLIHVSLHVLTALREVICSLTSLILNKFDYVKRIYQSRLPQKESLLHQGGHSLLGYGIPQTSKLLNLTANLFQERVIRPLFKGDAPKEKGVSFHYGAGYVQRIWQVSKQLIKHFNQGLTTALGCTALSVPKI